MMKQKSKTAVQISICAESDEESEVTSDASELKENEDRFTSQEKESIMKIILQNGNLGSSAKILPPYDVKGQVESKANEDKDKSLNIKTTTKNQRRRHGLFDKEQWIL